MSILNIKKREDYSGHAARRERKKGFVPGVIYGNDAANYMFEVGDIELASVLSHTGYHGVIDVNVDGNVEKVLIKNVQKDPVTHKPIHVDLQDIEHANTVLCDVPIVYKNEGSVTSLGAIIQKQKNNIKIKCSPSNIMENIEIDIDKHKVGDIVRICDLSIPSDVTVVEDKNTVIMSINFENKNKNEGEKEESLS